MLEQGAIDGNSIARKFNFKLKCMKTRRDAIRAKGGENPDKGGLKSLLKRTMKENFG